MIMTELNAREKLLAIADWLGWQNENLSFGLKSPEDAVKLYNYWQERADSLPEMADDEQDDEGRWLFMFRRQRWVMTRWVTTLLFWKRWGRKVRF